MKQLNPIPFFLRRMVMRLPFNPRERLYRALYRTQESDKSVLVLDAACGHGGNALVTRFHNPKLVIVGFDIFPPYVHECREMAVYDHLLIADVRYPPFRDNSFVAAYFTGAIEHIEKIDATKALNELERISLRLIVTTPVGLYLRGEGEITDGNICQNHISGWIQSEFEKRGYLVWGIFPCFLSKLLVHPLDLMLLHFLPFSFVNLIPLPVDKSLSMAALKVQHE